VIQIVYKIFYVLDQYGTDRSVEHEVRFRAVRQLSLCHTLPAVSKLSEVRCHHTVCVCVCVCVS